MVRAGNRTVAAASKARSARQILLEHVVVDGEACQRTLAGGDDRELHPARGVAGDVEPRDFGPLVGAGLDRALLAEAAAEHADELGALALAGVQEQRLAGERRPALEVDAPEAAL